MSYDTVVLDPALVFGDYVEKSIYLYVEGPWPGEQI